MSHVYVVKDYAISTPRQVCGHGKNVPKLIKKVVALAVEKEIDPEIITVSLGEWDVENPEDVSYEVVLYGSGPAPR